MGALVVDVAMSLGLGDLLVALGQALLVTVQRLLSAALESARVLSAAVVQALASELSRI